MKVININRIISRGIRKGVKSLNTEREGWIPTADVTLAHSVNVSNKRQLREQLGLDEGSAEFENGWTVLKSDFHVVVYDRGDVPDRFVLPAGTKVRNGSAGCPAYAGSVWVQYPGVDYSVR